MEQKTLFYNGEMLWQDNEEEQIDEYFIYNEEERESWQVIVNIPGVEIIPEGTFSCCGNVEKVVMADSVQRIEESAFDNCKNLTFVKLSRNLQYIGKDVFFQCISLSAIFIPPSCRLIDDGAFKVVRI